MTMTDEDDFDEALRRWAGRPPVTSGTDAARAVVERLAAEREQPSVGQGFPSTRWRRKPSAGSLRAGSLAGQRLSPAWATLALAIVAILAGTTSFIRSLPPVARTRNVVTPPAGTVPARDADLILWLDEETPVSVFLPGDGQAMR
jgi:hypothetical protein